MKPLVAHCMGVKGLPSRILGAALGNIFTYAYLPDIQETKSPTQPIAEGLLDIHTLIQTYRIRSLNRATQFFGLLGSPVSQSLGHILHNRIFAERNYNGVYVKWDLLPEELPIFLKALSALPFKGFSVTTPLKEVLYPQLSAVITRDSALRAFNTLHVTEDGLIGCNTDGVGVVRALESVMPLAGQTLILLGAGGAASGIAFALGAAKAHLIILNRNLDRALQLVAALQAQGYTAEAYGLDSLPEALLAKSTAIVNALAGHIQLPTALLQCLAAKSGLYLLDINCFYPDPALETLAKDRYWTIIPGLNTFYLEQAYEQLRLWDVLPSNQALSCITKVSTPVFLVEEKA